MRLNYMTRFRFTVMLVTISAILVCAAATFAVQNTGNKTILGKWEGTGKETASGEEQSITVNFKEDGKSIVAEIFSQAGNWTTSNVSFGDGKWTIIWSTPDGENAKVTATVKADVMSGTWTMGDSLGTFELKRTGK